MDKADSEGSLIIWKLINDVYITAGAGNVLEFRAKSYVKAYTNQYWVVC
jgi:hypothetical protein